LDRAGLSSRLSHERRRGEEPVATAIIVRVVVEEEGLAAHVVSDALPPADRYALTVAVG
jgi:hypothetical protein